MDKKKSIFASIIGGQILLRRGGLVKHWKFVLYVFFLVVLCISIHFGVKDTMLAEVNNQEIIKDLKVEYIGKNAKLLYMSKRGEVEKMLLEKKSTLVAPTLPPTTIVMPEYVR